MKNLILIIAFGSLMSSCTVPLYVPNAVNTTTLTKQGEIEAAVYTGTNGWDLQGAYAFTDHFGIILNGSYSSVHSDSSSRYREHLLGEMGLGYTDILNKDASDGSAKFIYSTFIGGGYGTAEGLTNFSNIFNSDIKYTNISSGDYSKFFIQPAIGMSTKNLELFMNLKMNYIHFDRLQNYIDADWNDAITEDGLKYNFYYEPTITFRAGSQLIKGSLQTGVSIGQFPDNRTAFRGRPFILIWGIHFNFNN